MEQPSLLQKITNGLGITSAPIDVIIWLDTIESSNQNKQLELCALRINRKLAEDQVSTPDVCRFTKFVSTGKKRPGRPDESYRYGMRITLPINETEYERVKDAIESKLWATSLVKDWRVYSHTFLSPLPKVDIKQVWVERLSDEDVREKLLMQEELIDDLKKQYQKMVEHYDTENGSLKTEVKQLNDQIDQCRCTSCYVNIV